MFDLSKHNLDTAIENNLATFVSLMKPKKIETTDLSDSVWKILNNQYASTNDAVSLDIISLLNAVYNQKRVIFSYSRKNAKELAKSDPQRRGGFSNDRYKAVLKQIITLGIVDVVEPHTKTRPGIYRLKEPTILAALSTQVNEQNQYNEAYRFIAQTEDEKFYLDSKLLVLDGYSDELDSVLESVFTGKYVKECFPENPEKVADMIGEITGDKVEPILEACQKSVISFIKSAKSIDSKHKLVCKLVDLMQEVAITHGLDYKYYKDNKVPMPDYMEVAV